jgi:hypothetical protein
MRPAIDRRARIGQKRTVIRRQSPERQEPMRKTALVLLLTLGVAACATAPQPAPQAPQVRVDAKTTLERGR